MRKSNRIVVDTDAETKEKLMEMSLWTRKTQKEIIEKFINEAYEEMKKERNK